MKKRLKKRQKKTFECDRVSASLVQWLNAVPGKPAEFRDSDLHSMARNLSSLNTLAEELNWSVPVQEEKEKWLEFERLRDSINSRMFQFATYPAINTDSLYIHGTNRGSGKPVEFRRTFPLHGDDGPYRYRLVRCGGPHSADPDAAVSLFKQIHVFLVFEELLRRDWGWRLKICHLPKCRRWFCARTRLQVHCSSPARCSKTKYAGSPQGKIAKKKQRERQKQRELAEDKLRATENELLARKSFKSNLFAHLR
jgi:hypothetical protein